MMTQSKTKSAFSIQEELHSDTLHYTDMIASRTSTGFYWCLPLCQTYRPVRDQWEYTRKMERHFPIKPGQPLFIPFPHSLYRAKNLFVKNGTANFSRNIPTEINGPPREVIPNIPVGRSRNGPCHLNFDRNIRNLWHDGIKAPHATKHTRH